MNFKLYFADFVHEGSVMHKNTVKRSTADSRYLDFDNIE